MFKEQLHKSFDAISPSPELLDRISAMMSEEVSRPKPAIKMTAVKYGGIAAALALAAGGTFFVMQNANSGITSTNKTSEAVAARDGAAEATEAIAQNDIVGAAEFAPAAAPETFAADAEAEETTTTYQIYAAGEELDEYAEENAADIDSDIRLKTEEVPAAETTAAAPVTTALCTSDDDKINDIAAADADEYDNCGDTAGVYAIELCDDDADMCEASESVPFTGTLQWANPSSGEGTAWDTEPTVRKFYDIPLELQVKADGVVEPVDDGYVIGEKSKEYSKACYVPPDEMTGVDKGINIFTFIQYFGISDDDVRDALSGRTTLVGSYTDEEIEILLSGDKEKIASAFASQYAIVKGEKLYSPYWLDTHSYDEWREAGITKKDIRQKYDELVDLPVYLTDETTRAAYKARIDGFLSGKADTGGVLYTETGEKTPTD